MIATSDEIDTNSESADHSALTDLRGPVTRQFITGGRSTFTLAVPASFSRAASGDIKPHYTFQVVEKSYANSRYPLLFASVLTNAATSDDGRTWRYLAMVDRRNGNLLTTKSSPAAVQQSWNFRLLQRVLTRVWKDEQSAIAAAGFVLLHDGRCSRCQAKLTTPQSVLLGMGPVCWKNASEGR
jgi:hypothetical protein